jgi:hypothetical protein
MRLQMPAPRSSVFTVLWVVIVLYGLWGGWQTPSLPEARAFPAGVFGWVVAFLPLVLFGAAWFLPVSGTLERPSPRLEQLMDRVLGAGAYQKTFREFGIAAWLGTGALLHGVIGLVRLLVAGAPENALLYSTFYICGGIGMWSAYVARRRRLGGGSHGAA